MTDHPFSPLVLSAMTLPRTGFVERVKAAASAGYEGIGLRPRDRRRAHADGLDDPDLRAVLAHHGIDVVEIEALHRWGVGGERSARAREHEDELYALADALGGRHLTVTGDLQGPFDAVVERFAGVCDRAAEHGLTVALEFLPWNEVPDAATAWAIVQASGRSNAGVLVDSWHHFRGAADDRQLTAVPPDRIVAVQFDDADAQVEGTLLEDTLHRRRLPGQGDLDLVGFLRLLAGHGVRAPLGVEVIADDLVGRPAAEVARLTMAATREVLEAALSAEVPT